jgi:hypothetical protein
MDRYYPNDARRQMERADKVLEVRESVLIPILEILVKRNPQANLFNLPHGPLGRSDYVEIGFRGGADVVEAAFSDLTYTAKKGCLSF